MKKYKFILIDKNNMSELNHFSTRESVCAYLYGKYYEQLLMFILIKDEIEIVDFTPLKNVGGDQINFNKRLNLLLG